jgi:cbb3-type cytochrome oxidase cytochrome c subunit
MHHAGKMAVAIGVFAVAIVAAPRSAHAQEAKPTTPFTIDEAAAKKGKSLFSSRGCNGCHTIGKGKMAGPDLANVNDRRTQEWLHAWLKDPPAMMATDETAKALLAEYKGMKMPNLQLKDDEITALLHHIAKESQKVKK